MSIVSIRHCVDRGLVDSYSRLPCRIMLSGLLEQEVKRYPGHRLDVLNGALDDVHSSCDECM